MKKGNRIIYEQIIVISLLSQLFLGCETELEIWDEWSNVPIVYSIINPKDSVHTIRINRMFSGEASNNEMAAQPDSLIFDYDIDVRMLVFDESNSLLQTCRFQKEYIIKDSVNLDGEVVFATQKHHVYVYRGAIPDESPNVYKIEFALADGHKVEATATSLTNFSHRAVIPPPPIFLYINNFLHFYYALPQDIGCLNILVSFAYYEVMLDGIIQKKVIQVDSSFSQVRHSKENPSEVRKSSLSVNKILSTFRNNIDSTDNDIKERYLGKMEINYILGSDTFADYVFFRPDIQFLELENPGNIIGGYGVFGTRRSIKVSGVTIDVGTYDLFYNSLKNHKFRPSRTYPLFFSNLPDSLQ